MDEKKDETKKCPCGQTGTHTCVRDSTTKIHSVITTNAYGHSVVWVHDG